MTDLANRAFSSRSATSGQVDRLVVEGLGRGEIVVVMARLAEAVPVHLKAGSKLFVERLHDELALLERALDKGEYGIAHLPRGPVACQPQGSHVVGADGLPAATSIPPSLRRSIGPEPPVELAKPP